MGCNDEGRGSVSVVVNPGLALRLERVRNMVSTATRAAGRRTEDVTIVAVSKTIDRAAVDAAVALGLRHFGENRVQEAARKFAEPLPEGCFLHLIGQLQSNKARQAVPLFDVVESVDRPSLIDALEKEAARHERPLAVLLQVNVAREPQKAGCAPEEAPALLEKLVASDWLSPQGLMTMAPLVDDPEAVRPVFAGLRKLRDDLQRQQPMVELSTLSMGMSNDFAIAIEEGATQVRIGRAIFGE
jgi:PLP dependent protein